MYESLDELMELLDGQEKLFPTGMENAIIGTVERFGMEPQILLDRDKCIEILMENSGDEDTPGMTREEAEEYFEFNTIGAWMGDGTPCFAVLIRKET